MILAQHGSIRPCASIRQARTAWKVAASRGRTVTVYNVFSLSKVLNTSIGRPNAAAVEVAAPAQAPIHPRKAVQAVSLADRPSVELLMALTRAAGHPTGALATQLTEHELQLVTTSATCDDMFGSALDSFSEDFGESGDGMALPLADIRAAAELMAAEIRTANGSSSVDLASDWNPSGSGSFGGSSVSFAGQPGAHTLEQLQAQSDYERLSGGGGLRAEASRMFAHVQSLQNQIKSAAAAAGKAASTGGSNNGSRATVSIAGKQAGPPRPTSGSASDDDVYGDSGAMPVVPCVGDAGMRSSYIDSSMAALKRAAEPTYPTYGEAASSWFVADSADASCKLRHIVIQAPESLAAAVAGTRASSDLTTFENYSMGAKINKRLYNEANALYNRFMPLVLDHIEESGPGAKFALCGSGLGGSLAALLLLMFVARGMQPGLFAPVYTLNAPAVLCEVPDFKQWCSKDGCSLQDMDGMLEDLLHRGILSQLGLPLDSVRNVYHQQAAAEAAVQAVSPLLSPLQAVAASGSKAVQYLDVASLQDSSLVPEVLKGWLRSSEGPRGAAAVAGYQRLHILNPVGKMMLYMGSSRR
eukprot:GHRQ01000705.1.p1 GENE.GHRQ01000705.1~~GHRQ01000705.1.p1  ORF type:complete len:585 (+),score=272.37 GHRQ01000705.1:456-2210(+)